MEIENMIPDEESLEALLLGGALLGGGGGGSLEEGRAFGLDALRRGQPRILPLAEVDPAGLLATVSAVGAPAASDTYLVPQDFVRAVEILSRQLDTPLAGLITSENGGFSSVNGLVQSAVLGLPVVDAPCDGRAHPTGVMGSMGLESRPGYLSRQAAAGGNPASGRHLELYVEGTIPGTDALVRRASVEAGGLIAVARNPVEAAYVAEHGAPGALAQAIRLGRRLMSECAGGIAVAARRIADDLGGAVIGQGGVQDYMIETRGGFDFGRARVGDLDLIFWNEYMALDRGGRRLATFPDLIATLDVERRVPCTTAELSLGMQVIVVCAPRKKLFLGSGAKDPKVLKEINQALADLHGLRGG